MERGSRPRWVFLIAAPACGFIFWWFADWWAYVDHYPEGPLPKFIMPWPWQVIESGIVGAATGGILIGLWRLVGRGWSRRRSPGAV